MKRSELKRHTFLQARTPMRQVSNHRQRENRERARLRAEIGPVACEARIEGVCTGMAQDWHERLSRARGGSITDPSNRVMVCRPCHDWVGTHPRAATELGLLRHSWDWPLCAACEIPHDPTGACFPGMAS